MSPPPELSGRARLYDRLPVTADIDWWLEHARRSPGGRVLELGAGTGRLTLPLAEVAEVTAVDHDPAAVDRLAERAAARGRQVRTMVADVVDLELGERYGAVLLPVSLLNEIPDARDRERLVETAVGHCRADGVVIFQLLNPLWLLSGGESSGVIEGVDGEQVELTARHTATDLAAQRATARLRYVFADGEVIVDELAAAAVFPRELELLLARAGFGAVTWCGEVPGERPLADDDGAWHAVARRA